MFMNYNGIVEEYDIYIELKFFELKLLKKLVVKYGISAWFGLTGDLGSTLLHNLHSSLLFVCWI